MSIGKRRATRPAQRGAVALTVTLLLLFALTLGSLALRRQLDVEQRDAANRSRAAVAFEAAEAGLAWAQGALNRSQAVGPDCTPSADPSLTSLREQTLRLDRVTGAISVATFAPRCVHGTGGWACTCSTSGATGATTPSGDGPAFAVTLAPGERPGQLRVSAQGCTTPAGVCRPGDTTVADASAATSLTLALYPGLSRVPTTALMVRDPGRQTGAQFFASFFGTDALTWRAQPAVTPVACGPADCGKAIAAAAAAGAQLIAVEGALNLAGPLTLGSAARPLVIVASGALRVDGSVQLLGVVYASAVTLGAPGASVRGAVLSENAYAGPSTPDLRLDADVLAALTHQTGSFVRVSGSWRDF